MKASFFKRLAAYLFDAMIVTVITGIISSGFTSTKYERAYDEYLNIMDSYTNFEITANEYLEQIGPVIYDMQKASIIVLVITLIASVAYFVVFQYLNKGQTLGKKVLGLRVVEEDREPSIKAMIIRTFFVNEIFVKIFAIALLYILSRKTYYLGYSIMSIIDMVFIFVCALFILYRKDKKGLHDIMSHTEVIDERGK